MPFGWAEDFDLVSERHHQQRLPLAVRNLVGPSDGMKMDIETQFFCLFTPKSSIRPLSNLVSEAVRSIIG